MFGQRTQLVDCCLSVSIFTRHLVRADFVVSAFSRFLRLGRGVDDQQMLQSEMSRDSKPPDTTALLQLPHGGLMLDSEDSHIPRISVDEQSRDHCFQSPDSFFKWLFFCRPFDHCSSNIPVEFLCQCPPFVLQTYLLKATDLHTWQVIAESNSLRLSCPCPNLPHIDYSHTVSVLWIGTVSCWVTFSISPPSPLCRRPLSSPVHLSVAAASRWASDPAPRTATQRKGHRDTKSDEKGDAASLLNGSCDIHTAEVLLKEAAVASSAYDRIIYKRLSCFTEEERL